MTSRIEKLEAMAADTSSPNEAKIARARLDEMRDSNKARIDQMIAENKARIDRWSAKNKAKIEDECDGDSFNGTINIKMSGVSGGVGGFGGSYTGNTGSSGQSWHASEEKRKHENRGGRLFLDG